MHAERNLIREHAPPAGEARDAPLLAHVIYRLDVGGLENGLVNLINRIPAARYRHAIICLTDYSDFRRRIERSDVSIYSLNKPRGNSPAMHFKLWRLLKRLAPDIVHTRNLAALEGTLPAALAGVGVRIHGEHGRDIEDLDGSNRGRQRVRRLFKPFVHHYVAVSRDLASYLEQRVGVSPDRITQIYNGVNDERFHPPRNGREPLPWSGAGQGNELFVIGTVGRMEVVKDPLNLVRAFILARQSLPQQQRPRLRLAMAGDGSLRQQALALLGSAGVLDAAWLPGRSDDIPGFMRGLDLFVLPSLAEGISNTVLEAMATGLPVVATDVGGNPELVRAGVTGLLVPPSSPESLAQAICRYVGDPPLRRQHGQAGRRVIEESFGMQGMVEAYLRVYDGALARSRRATRNEAR